MLVEQSNNFTNSYITPFQTSQCNEYCNKLKIGKGHLKRRMMKKSQDPSLKRCKKTFLSFSVVGPEQSSVSMQNV